MIDDMDQEILDEFIIESKEQLNEMESNLVELDANRARGEALDEERVNATFRAFHSMKGSGSFLGFNQLATVAHRAESLLDLIRAGELAITEDHVTILCDTIDFCRAALAVIVSQSSDESMANPATELLARLQAMLDASSEPKAAAPAAKTGVPVAAATSAAVETGNPEAETSEAEAPVDDDAGLEALAAALAEVAAPPNAALPPAESAVRNDTTNTTPPNIDTTPASKPQKAAAKTPTPGKPESEQSIRVGLDKLDTLMNLVGELIIAENMVTHNQDLEGLELQGFNKAATQLNRITRGLQDLAMSVRMVPIRPTFRKMMRVVRDVARKQHKDVQVVLTGEETEVDKRVIEAITDPLVHLLRNAVDHGIESPDDRDSAGKPRTGTIHLEARHEAGDVWIVITDNGKGIDRDRVFAKARERGLISGEIDSVPDAQIFGMILEPGFSTAETITDVSGRGVGMDVVKRNIEALNGRIDVSSSAGEGTTIALRIPLTMAIVEGMLARVGEHTYAVPMLSVREIVSYNACDVTTLADGTQLLNSRGAALPIVKLSELHGVEDDQAMESLSSQEQGVLVIVEDDGKRLCIFVDQIIGQRQTVIKALPSYLGHLTGLSGCSILNSGDISLILDVREVISETSVSSSSANAA